jgi:predicted DNA-binding transcriptional regulator AlpA
MAFRNRNYIRLNARNIKFEKRDVDEWLRSKKVDPRRRDKEGE